MLRKEDLEKVEKGLIPNPIIGNKVGNRRTRRRNARVFTGIKNNRKARKSFYMEGRMFYVLQIIQANPLIGSPKKYIHHFIPAVKLS